MVQIMPNLIFFFNSLTFSALWQLYESTIGPMNFFLKRWPLQYSAITRLNMHKEIQIYSLSHYLSLPAIIMYITLLTAFSQFWLYIKIYFEYSADSFFKRGSDFIFNMHMLFYIKYAEFFLGSYFSLYTD